MSIANLRQHYEMKGLHKVDLNADPMRQFRVWFDDAAGSGVLEPNAVTLATCSADGTPAARIVLLKGIEGGAAEGEGGEAGHAGRPLPPATPGGRGAFVFYTSYLSDKAGDLHDHPRASLLFYWDRLARQVRIVGDVTRTSRAESEAYFAGRPEGSQIGAWASRQSRVLRTRDELEASFEEAAQRFRGGDTPCPPYWGGYRVVPDHIEFWQGQGDRLHDRFRYTWTGGAWTLDRLAP